MSPSGTASLAVRFHWPRRPLRPMTWATSYIALLRTGKTVSFRPRGGSMSPRIESGQLCTVAPVTTDSLAVGDIVLCEVGRTQYLHFIKGIEAGRYLIGNNRGGLNGWIDGRAIFGRLTEVRD